MDSSIVCLVLTAALLHATWNALLKSGADRLATITIMQTATMVLAAASLPFFPMPAPESWPYLLAGMTLHYAYRMSLIYGYSQAELGEIYPLARGTSPLIVTIGMALLAGEHLGPVAYAGIALTSAGIFLLRRSGVRSLPSKALATGLAIGGIIASYTIVDGLGARVSGSPIAFMLVLSLAGGPTTIATYVAVRGWRRPRTNTTEIAKAVASGVVSMLAYGTVIWATTLGPMGPIAALRESSVLFAALIGAVFLKERFTLRRVIACSAVAIGAGCVGVA